MDTPNFWLEARRKANTILNQIKGKIIVVNQYYENNDRLFEYECEVVMVNPCQSFENGGEFDFYVVVKEIGKDNGAQFHFLLEKVVHKLK